MKIIASNSGVKRELIPASNYVARAYSMVHIGNVTETIMGQEKTMNKIRITWELPTELKVFDKDKGEQPLVISKEFSLSMHEKATLRKTLASWRGKDFTPDEVKEFDVTTLMGVPCLLNIIHKPSKDGSKMYQEISSISPVPKGMTVPKQINPTFVLSYDDWNDEKFNTLPDFIRDKMKGSLEYQQLHSTDTVITETYKPYGPEDTTKPGALIDDLPF